MDRGAWQATVRRVAKSQTRLSVHASIQPVLLLLLVFKKNEERTWDSCQKVKRRCGRGQDRPAVRGLPRAFPTAVRGLIQS